MTQRVGIGVHPTDCADIIMLQIIFFGILVERSDIL